MNTVTGYVDLFEIIGHEVEMAGCFSSQYWEWEQNVAEPELNDRGYSVVEWIHGERDSFGPLSRVAVVLKDGVESRLVYG